MSVRKLTAADAVMLLPASLPSERVIDALAWLGISRDVVGMLTRVEVEPHRVVFSLIALREPDPRPVTVEARIDR